MKNAATYKTRKRTFNEVEVKVIGEHDPKKINEYAQNLEHNKFLRLLRGMGLRYELK